MKKSHLTVVLLALIAIVIGVALVPSVNDKSQDIQQRANNALAENKFVVMQMSSTTCQLCRTMAPYIDELREEMSDNYEIIDVDVDVNRDLASQLQVTGVPTTIILGKDGRIAYKKSGFMTKAELKSAFLSVQ